MRLIDAERLAKEIDRAWTLWEKKGENCYIFSDVITPLIVSQPTIEPDRPHGEWKNTRPPYMSDNIVCSVCSYDSIAEYNFCPNCGAKMTNFK